jgi:single-stranded-DNA-specific exonuclease
MPPPWRGSARPVDGVHARVPTPSPRNTAVDPGNSAATDGRGFDVERARLDEFAQVSDREVARWLAVGGAPDTIETDGELTTAEIALPTAELLRAGGPWGTGFPEPLFDGEFELRQARVVGERHLKLQVAAPEGRGTFEAIAFNQIDPHEGRPLPSGRTRLIYRLGTNDYQGERRLQLVIEHLLPAGA